MSQFDNKIPVRHLSTQARKVQQDHPAWRSPNGPAAEGSGQLHKVEPGDTLWKLASVFLQKNGSEGAQVSIADLVQLLADSNNIKNVDRIWPGDEIRFPAVQANAKVNVDPTQVGMGETNTTAFAKDKEGTDSLAPPVSKALDQLKAINAARQALVTEPSKEIAQHQQTEPANPIEQIATDEPQTLTGVSTEAKVDRLTAGISALQQSLPLDGTPGSRLDNDQPVDSLALGEVHGAKVDSEQVLDQLQKLMYENPNADVTAQFKAATGKELGSTLKHNLSGRDLIKAQAFVRNESGRLETWDNAYLRTKGMGSGEESFERQVVDKLGPENMAQFEAMYHSIYAKGDPANAPLTGPFDKPPAGTSPYKDLVEGDYAFAEERRLLALPYVPKGPEGQRDPAGELAIKASEAGNEDFVRLFEGVDAGTIERASNIYSDLRRRDLIGGGEHDDMFAHAREVLNEGELKRFNALRNGKPAEYLAASLNDQFGIWNDDEDEMMRLLKDNLRGGEQGGPSWKDVEAIAGKNLGDKILANVSADQAKVAGLMIRENLTADHPKVQAQEILNCSDNDDLVARLGSKTPEQLANIALAADELSGNNESAGQALLNHAVKVAGEWDDKPGGMPSKAVALAATGEAAKKYDTKGLLYDAYGQLSPEAEIYYAKGFLNDDEKAITKAFAQARQEADMLAMYNDTGTPTAEQVEWLMSERFATLTGQEFAEHNTLLNKKEMAAARRELEPMNLSTATDTSALKNLGKSATDRVTAYLDKGWSWGQDLVGHEREALRDTMREFKNTIGEVAFSVAQRQDQLTAQKDEGGAGLTDSEQAKINQAFADYAAGLDASVLEDEAKVRNLKMGVALATVAMGFGGASSLLVAGTGVFGTLGADAIDGLDLGSGELLGDVALYSTGSALGKAGSLLKTSPAWGQLATTGNSVLSRLPKEAIKGLGRTALANLPNMDDLANMTQLAHMPKLPAGLAKRLAEAGITTSDESSAAFKILGSARDLPKRLAKRAKQLSDLVDDAALSRNVKKANKLISKGNTGGKTAHKLSRAEQSMVKSLKNRGVHLVKEGDGWVTAGGTDLVEAARLAAARQLPKSAQNNLIGELAKNYSEAELKLYATEALKRGAAKEAGIFRKALKQRSASASPDNIVIDAVQEQQRAAKRFVHKYSSNLSSADQKVVGQMRRLGIFITKNTDESWNIVTGTNLADAAELAHLGPKGFDKTVANAIAKTMSKKEIVSEIDKLVKLGAPTGGKQAQSIFERALKIEVNSVNG